MCSVTTPGDTLLCSCHICYRFVTKELLDRGYNVIALAREKAGIKGKMSKDDVIKVITAVTFCWYALVVGIEKAIVLSLGFEPGSSG